MNKLHFQGYYQADTGELDLENRVKQLEKLVDLENKQLEVISNSFDKLSRVNRVLYKNKVICI